MTLKAADHYPNFSSDAFEIQINGKLIFSKTQLGHFPDMAEMVEITKWGNKVFAGSNILS